MRAERLERRLDNAVEYKRGIHEHGETHNLEPLERLPAQAERNDPDKECPAGIDSRARGSTDIAGDGKTEEVEATVTNVSSAIVDTAEFACAAYPILIIINKLVTQRFLSCVI